MSRVSREELAKVVNVKLGRIEAIENGEAEPTFRQLTLIAGKLDRPLGFFFAPPPEEPDVPTTADFRGRGDAQDDLPSELMRELRRAEQHRATMLDFGDRKRQRAEIGRITWDTVTEQSSRLRRDFGLTETFVPPESTNNQVFNFWRGALEQNGILVLQTTGIDLKVFRGLSVYHTELPFIIVNGADSSSGRSFTLFHEMAHLANRTSGLCGLRESVDEEAIANNFAAAFLMPEREVRARLPKSDDPNELVIAAASRFKVSELAAAVRLRRLGVISKADLDAVRSLSDERWEQARRAQKDEPGFVPPWRLRYRDLGPTYIGTVAKALEDNRIDYVDATYLLNARLPMVERMLEEYYRTGGSE